MRVLITGMSGTGKSSALVELEKRGYRVVDTDSREYAVLSEWIAAGAPGPKKDDPRIDLRPGDLCRELVSPFHGCGPAYEIATIV